MTEVIVVSSGCTDGTERIVESWQREDKRIVLVRQAERMGKTRALNEVLDRARGELIVFLNGDACLDDNALAGLLRPFVSDPSVVVACGAPTARPVGGGVTQIAANFQWELHNRTLETLSQRGLPNHCCDEFMAFRRGFVLKFPPDLVNDGAYLGALASLQGASVRFCPEARVTVETPRSVRSFLAQRRRILRGHDQIEELLRHSANTLENLSRTEPALALAIVTQEIFSRPRALLAFFCVVLPLELFAKLFAIGDRVRRIRHNPAWDPVE